MCVLLENPLLGSLKDGFPKLDECAEIDFF